jgi:hypothetical protein
MSYRPLEELFDSFIEREKEHFKRMHEEEEKENAIGFLQLDNQLLALYSMHIIKDFKGARNYFYKAALCGEYMVKNYDELMDTSIYKICCAVLSDNIEIMNRYGTLRNKVVNKNFIGYIFNTAIKSVILKDNDELTLQVERFKIATTKKGAKGFVGMINVFEGIKDKNKVQVEKGLNELIKSHGKRGEFGIAKNYFSFETSAVAKLACLQGIDVEINNSLMPMEIVRIEELPFYEGYEL